MESVDLLWQAPVIVHLGKVNQTFSLALYAVDVMFGHKDEKPLKCIYEVMWQNQHTNL